MITCPKSRGFRTRASDQREKRKQRKTKTFGEKNPGNKPGNWVKEKRRWKKGKERAKKRKDSTSIEHNVQTSIPPPLPPPPPPSPPHHLFTLSRD